MHSFDSKSLQTVNKVDTNASKKWPRCESNSSIKITRNYTAYAEGSVLVEFGNTKFYVMRQ